MIHKNRRFCVADVARAGDLVMKFKGPVTVWTRCTGFRYKGWLWLNDSTGPDGAQEYAVVKEDTMVQWESITVSWATEEFLRGFIGQVERGEIERPFHGHVDNKIETTEEHKRTYCPLCA